MNERILVGHRFQFVRFGRVTHAKAYRSPAAAVNDDSHLIHVTQGTGDIRVREELFALSPGAVIALPPFHDYRMRIDPGFEMLNFHYRIWLQDGLPLENVIRLPFVFFPEYFREVERTLRDGFASAVSGVFVQFAPVAHVVALRHLIANDPVDCRGGAVSSRLAAVCDRLANPACRKFDSAELARLCHLSVSQMDRRFRQCFGMSPRRFWETRRRYHVSVALMDTDRSLAEIAETFGFPDQAYLTHWFKRLVGTAPSEYRKQDIRF